MDALSGRRAPPPPGVNELRQRESAVFRWLRAESTLGWGWVRRPVPSRNEARNAQSRERQGPKVKTAAQRRLSLRPDCARAGLRRARAHERNLSPRGSSNQTARSVRETALSRTRSSVSSERSAASRASELRSFVERRSLDLARLEDLEHVAFFHVVEAFEQDAALEALCNFADVVLEPLQLRDRRRVDHGAVADDADTRVAADDAVRDHAAGDRAEPRHAKQRAHFRLADRVLRRDCGELADEGLFDVLGELVDDVVRADPDAFARGELARLGVRPDVEADDEGVGRGREHDVVLRDRTHSLGDHVEPHLRVLELRQLGDDGLDRADDVAADDEVEVGNLARLQLLVKPLERYSGVRAHGRELLASQSLPSPVRELASFTIVRYDACELARRGRLVEAEDLDRIARRRLLLAFALVVEERLDATVGV